MCCNHPWTCGRCNQWIPANWWHVCGRPYDGHPIYHPPAGYDTAYLTYAGPLPFDLGDVKPLHGCREPTVLEYWRANEARILAAHR